MLKACQLAARGEWTLLKVRPRDCVKAPASEEGSKVPFQTVATPSRLTLKAARGKIEICMPTADRIHFRLYGISLRFERPGTTSENSYASWAEPVDQAGDAARVLDYTASPRDLTLRLTSIRGGVSVENARSSWVSCGYAP